ATRGRERRLCQGRRTAPLGGRPTRETECTATCSGRCGAARDPDRSQTERDDSGVTHRTAFSVVELCRRLRCPYRSVTGATSWLAHQEAFYRHVQHVAARKAAAVRRGQ